MEIRQYQNRDWLYQKYVEEEQSIRQIAEALNLKGIEVSRETIRRYLKKFNIPARSSSEAHLIKRKRDKIQYHHRSYLEQKHLKEGLSIKRIARLNHVTPSTISAWIRGFKFPRWNNDLREEQREEWLKEQFRKERLH